MAPPHSPCSKEQCDREESNLEISILHHHDAELGYQRLADLTGSSNFQVHNIVKRSAERGYLNIYDAPHSGCPPIPWQARAEIEQLIDDNPQMPLSELASKYPHTISHTTIKNVADSAEDPFILLQTRKKSCFRATSAPKRLLFAHSCHDLKEDLRNHLVFHDETTYVLDPNPARHYGRIWQSELIEPVLSTKLLWLTFQSGRTPIPLWAPVAYGFKSQRMPVRRRTEEERRPTS